MMGKFWWGQKGRERRLAWVSWEKLCKPKSEGGIRFRDLKAFNLASTLSEARMENFGESKLTSS